MEYEMKIKVEFPGTDTIPKELIGSGLMLVREITERVANMVTRGLILQGLGSREADIAIQALMGNLQMIDDKLIDIWNQYYEQAKEN